MGGLLQGKHIFLVPAGRANFNAGSSACSRADIKKWVDNGNGTFEKELTDRVTHVVCQDGDYKDDANFNKAVKMREARKVNIVTFDWLFQVLSLQKSQPVSNYLIKLESPPKAAGVVEDLHDVFMVGTKAHVDSRKQATFDKVTAAEEDKKREQKAAEINRERIKKDEEARNRMLQRQKARLAKQPGKGLYPDHLIYRDAATGSLFDVRLTKVDILSNTNARVVLTIFESNAEPPTYALNMRVEGSKKETKNEELACTGTNFPTTYRVFREAFRELTGVDWEQRFEQCVEGSPYFEMVEAMEYEKRPYNYSIPSIGPTGAPIAAPVTDSPSATQQTTTELSSLPKSPSLVNDTTMQETDSELPVSSDLLMADDSDYVLAPGAGESTLGAPAAQLDLGESMLGQRIAHHENEIDMQDSEELVEA